MQVTYLKKVIFFLFFLFGITQSANCLSDIASLKKADSLYQKGIFGEAEKIFERELTKMENPSQAIYLKLAHVNEQKGDYLHTLFYLNKAYEQKPTEKILLKLHEIAQAHQLKGYEMNDFNLLILLYKQYAGFLVGLMLLIGIYVFVILFSKRFQRLYIPFSHKLIFTLYILGIATLLNLPDKYHQGIIKADGVILRTDPSAGSGIETTIDKGHRLNILGGEDIWRRAFWNDKIVYVKQSDIWMVE